MRSVCLLGLLFLVPACGASTRDIMWLQARQDQLEQTRIQRDMLETERTRLWLDQRPRR